MHQRHANVLHMAVLRSGQESSRSPSLSAMLLVLSAAAASAPSGFGSLLGTRPGLEPTASQRGPDTLSRADQAGLGVHGQDCQAHERRTSW